jgi:peptide/nickel transport system substrate-binding protein
MKRFEWRSLVVNSLLVGAALTAQAETRPQYGATLHLAMRAAPQTLDPADRSAGDTPGQRSMTALIFDTLVVSDTSGHVKGALAESWQAVAGSQRRRFQLRRGVRFQDGTALSAEVAAAALRFANPTWNVSVASDAITIDAPIADAELFAELALPRNSIAKREAGLLVGTGAFRIADWRPGSRLTLLANEDCWRGRPFLDSVEIEMGRSYRDQMTALQLGKIELAEVAPEQAHRASQEGRHPASSMPLELLALVFSNDASSTDEKTLREALSLSLERNSIRDVLLQGAGQPAAGILPNWISGYGFVFSSSSGDAAKARQIRNQVRAAPGWKLSYDSNDPAEKLWAERIALNAKDAGLSVQPTAGTGADVRIARMALASTDPAVALGEFLAQARMPGMQNNLASIEDVYTAERSALALWRVIPLVHLPVSYVSTAALRNWAVRADGSWDVGDAWLEKAH